MPSSALNIGVIEGLVDQSHEDDSKVDSALEVLSAGSIGLCKVEVGQTVGGNATKRAILKALVAVREILSW